MKKGHRRTQSANLEFHLPQERKPVQPTKSLQQKNNIIHLLHKCQLNTKQKVYQVESLQAAPQSEQDRIFNFGKGLLKVSLHKRYKADNNINHLMPIPQKSKQNTKNKKTTQLDFTPKSQPKTHYDSLYRISNKEIQKGEGHIIVGASRLIKLKIGCDSKESKERRLSMYESGRSSLKQWRHKKLISTFK